LTFSNLNPKLDSPPERAPFHLDFAYAYSDCRR
jgi:hypothetical protein